MKYLSHLTFSYKKAAAYLAALAVAILLPFIFSTMFVRHILIMIIIWAIAGIGWNFIGGYAGQVSIGHAVFFAIGVYTPAALFLLFKTIPWISFLIGILLSVVVAALIGLPLLRLRGPQFSIATMAIVECFRTVLINAKVIGGSTGIDFLNKKVNPILYMQFPNKLWYYYVSLTFLVIALAVSLYFDKSKFGYYLRTTAGNEMAAESIGIDTGKYKAAAFMLSAAFCSVSGSIYAQYLLYVDPYMCSTMSVSLMIVLVAVMGGVGTPVGPIIGSVVLTLISQYSRILFGGTGTGIDLIIYGVLVIIVVLFLPHGLLSIIEKVPAFIGKRVVRRTGGARHIQPDNTVGNETVLGGADK